MSSRVTRWMWNEAPRDLYQSEFLVALALAWKANDDGLSRPPIAELADLSRLSERQVIRHLQSLVSRDVIAVQEASARRLPTMYIFTAFRGEDLGVTSGVTDPVRGDIRDDIQTSPLDDSGVTDSTFRGDRSDIVFKGTRATVNTNKNTYDETPYGVFAAMCDAANLDIAAYSERDKNRYLAVAKRLIEKDGLTPTEMAGCVAWLRSQAWRTQPISIFSVEKELGTWRAAGRPTREPARRPTSQADHNRGGTGKVVV